MSAFGDVDAAGDDVGDRLLSYLQSTDAGLSAMKAYMVAAAGRAVGAGGVVVDVGCGLGADLDRLERAGLVPIGVDASARMLAAAANRVSSSELRQARGPGLLVCARAEALPFGDGSVDGCRIERVLQHVASPEAVVAEVARIVRPRGFVAVFEPDFGTFTVDTDDDEAAALGLPAAAMLVRHPDIGGRLAGLLEANGFRVDDIVTESSRGYAFDVLPVGGEPTLTRAAAEGRVGAEVAARWLAEQRARTAAGTFRARWDKICVVAHRLG